MPLQIRRWIVSVKRREVAEIEIKLDEMRRAAEAIRQSSMRIAVSVEEVERVMSEIFALGFSSAGILHLEALYERQRGVMIEWAGALAAFGDNLERAAGDIEQAALRPDGMRFNPLRLMLDLKTRRAISIPAAGSLSPGVPLMIGEWVSIANRPLYDRLLEKQAALAQNETRLTTLLTTRQQISEDLLALRNRVISFDQTARPENMPRVKALEDEIQRADDEAIQTQNHIAQIRMEIYEIQDRLARVAPAPGADLDLIRAMESGQTPAWVRANTEGCVQYIATRMNVPDGITRDAHLWIEEAAKMPQYGISVGDRPLAGSVIVMAREHSFADDAHGHLMYVERVDARGDVWITDNFHADPARLADVTTEVSGPNIRYLYFPWQTRG